ncbi:MAG: thioesterase superfamily domain protein [Myxococcaceae bacterium]|nr:thioesterase superfamily domain protein [Myxococcaceae bacterium]
MEPNTHLALSARLCGAPQALFAGGAEVELETSDEMRADERGLVHGGFIFGLADYAAMLAINEPNVVLGSAETRFLAPVVVGQRLRATARVLTVEGKRQRVEVHVARAEERVFEGTFVCFVPSQHVLDGVRKAGAA